MEKILSSQIPRLSTTLFHFLIKLSKIFKIFSVYDVSVIFMNSVKNQERVITRH
jgi:hypothetical protein